MYLVTRPEKKNMKKSYASGHNMEITVPQMMRFKLQIVTKFLMAIFVLQG